jgi:hypothetical protein
MADDTMLRSQDAPDERSARSPDDVHEQDDFREMMERVYEEERTSPSFSVDAEEALPTRSVYTDQSGTVYIEQEFTIEEFAKWYRVQRLGSRPFNAIGYHHTFIPTARQWAGIPSLRGIFNYYHNERGWDWGVGPHFWVYSGEGDYRPGVPKIYVGTHPAHDGYGIVGRNGQYAHIEHICNGDQAEFSEALKRVSGQLLGILCARHPHANRTIPLRFIRDGGVDNPSQPLGILYHRDQNPNWTPGAWPKSCPGLRVTHENLDPDLIRYATQGQQPQGDLVVVPERGVLTAVSGALGRKGPGRANAQVRRLEAGAKYDTDAYTDGGEQANGSARWYRLAPEAGGRSDDVVAQPGTLTAAAGALARGGPSREQAIVRRLDAGKDYACDGFTEHGQAVNGSSRWYRLADQGGWVHSSGGTFQPAETWVHASGGKYRKAD